MGLVLLTCTVWYLMAFAGVRGGWEWFLPCTLPTRRLVINTSGTFIYDCGAAFANASEVIIVIAPALPHCNITVDIRTPVTQLVSSGTPARNLTIVLSGGALAVAETALTDPFVEIAVNSTMKTLPMQVSVTLRNLTYRPSKATPPLVLAKFVPPSSSVAITLKSVRVFGRVLSGGTVFDLRCPFSQVLLEIIGDSVVEAPAEGSLVQLDTGTAPFAMGINVSDSRLTMNNRATVVRSGGQGNTAISLTGSNVSATNAAMFFACREDRCSTTLEAERSTLLMSSGAVLISLNSSTESTTPVVVQVTLSKGTAMLDGGTLLMATMRAVTILVNLSLGNFSVALEDGSRLIVVDGALAPAFVGVFAGPGTDINMPLCTNCVLVSHQTSGGGNATIWFGPKCTFSVSGVLIAVTSSTSSEKNIDIVVVEGSILAVYPGATLVSQGASSVVLSVTMAVNHSRVRFDNSGESSSSCDGWLLQSRRTGSATTRVSLVTQKATFDLTSYTQKDALTFPSAVERSTSFNWLSIGCRNIVHRRFEKVPLTPEQLNCTVAVQEQPSACPPRLTMTPSEDPSASGGTTTNTASARYSSRSMTGALSSTETASFTQSVSRDSRSSAVSATNSSSGMLTATATLSVANNSATGSGTLTYSPSLTVVCLSAAANETLCHQYPLQCQWCSTLRYCTTLNDTCVATCYDIDVAIHTRCAGGCSACTGLSPIPFCAPTCDCYELTPADGCDENIVISTRGYCAFCV